MTDSWIPLFGPFEISEGRLVFKGAPAPAPSLVTSAGPTAAESDSQEQSIEPTPPTSLVGVALTNRKMVSGRLQATVEFTETSYPTACELIVGYDTRSGAMVTAGIGGPGMYSIREWIPRQSSQSPVGTIPIITGEWAIRRMWGDRVNLKANKKYKIEVLSAGSNISLSIDDVEVLSTTLPAPIQRPRQVGVLCEASKYIVVEDFKVTAERPKAFIVMQFSPPYNEVYANVLKDACDAFDLEAIRADDIYGPGMIIRDVIEKLISAEVIIAEISPVNANVYFEVGYAFALQKPMILLAQHRPKDNPLPFDLAGFRVLFYDDSIAGKVALEAGLRRHLQEILGRGADSLIP